MSDQNKTEKATPRRRQKAREKGQVARSRDLVASVGAISAVILLAGQAPAFASAWRGFLLRTLDAAASGQQPAGLVWQSGAGLFRGVALAAGISWLLASVSGIAQGGLVFAPAALTPSPNRLNPASR